MADLSAIQGSARAAAAHGRERERVGPFLATYTPGTEHPYLNYAIPDDGADPGEAEVAALEAAFAARGLVPRVEALSRTAPAAEAALLAAGWEVEARLVVMTCSVASELGPPPGVELVVPEEPEAEDALVRVQAEAFGEPPPPPAAGGEKRALLSRGGQAVLALADGTPAAGGIVVAPMEGVAELAGLGVLEPFRRRGIGAAVTAELTRRALASGTRLVWLTPGDAGAERIYARAGFAVEAEMVHLRR